VTFRWKDYHAKGRIRYEAMTLDPGEFMRRFLLRVLPGGLHRIRHYGLLANCSRSVNLTLARHCLQVPAQERCPARIRWPLRGRPSSAGTAATQWSSCRPSSAARRFARPTSANVMNAPRCQRHTNSPMLHASAWPPRVQCAGPRAERDLAHLRQHSLRRNEPACSSSSHAPRRRAPAIAKASINSTTCAAVSSLESCSTPALHAGVVRTLGLSRGQVLNKTKH